MRVRFGRSLGQSLSNRPLLIGGWRTDHFGGWSNCLRVNGTAFLSVRAARWTLGQKPTHAPYWSIEREVCLPHGRIAAIRLAEHKTVLDHVSLPTDGKIKRTIRFSETSRARREDCAFEDRQ